MGGSQPKGNATPVIVFEYTLLCKAGTEKSSIKDTMVSISSAAFDYLRKCCLSDESESRFLRLKSWRGIEVLQVQNYAGVVRCPDGTHIEILPKNASTDGDAIQARLSLLMMLKTLHQFRHIQTNIASIRKQKMPLLEVFIAQFLACVNDLIKKGIKSDYVQVQNNSAFLKGKLLASQQLRHNFVNRHKFFVEYDEYLPDRPENRLIHSALAKVAAYTQLNSSQKLVRELLFAFADVPQSRRHRDDFSGVRLQRGMSHYEAPMAWTKLILEGYSPQAMAGQNEAYSLLFPMQEVFESFVAAWFKKKLAGSVTVSSQVQKESLVSYNGTAYFKLKPDLMFSWDDKQMVLDTKWKLINEERSAKKDKFGLSQQDFYQMLAYGHKYLKGQGELVLIYPKSSTFKKPLEHSFDFEIVDDSVEGLKLWVVPFDISHDCEKRINWPKTGERSKLGELSKIASQ